MKYDLITEDNHPKGIMIEENFDRLFELGNLIKKSTSFQEKTKYITEFEDLLTGSVWYWWTSYQKLYLDPETIDSLLFYKYTDKNGKTVKVPIIYRNNFLSRLDLSSIDWTDVNFDIDNNDVPEELKAFNEKRKYYGTSRNITFPKSHYRIAEYYFDYTGTNIKPMDFSKIQYLRNCKFDGLDLSESNIDCIKEIFECSFENCNLSPEIILKFLKLIDEQYEKYSSYPNYDYNAIEASMKNSIGKNRKSNTILWPLSLIISINEKSYGPLIDLSFLFQEHASFSISLEERKEIIEKLSYYNKDWEERCILKYFYDDDYDSYEEAAHIIYGEKYDYIEDSESERTHAKFYLHRIMNLIKNGTLNDCEIYYGNEQTNNHSPLPSVKISKDTAPEDVINNIFPELLHESKFWTYNSANFSERKIAIENRPSDIHKDADDHRTYAEIIDEYKLAIQKLEGLIAKPLVDALMKKGAIPNVIKYVHMDKQSKITFFMWIAYCINNITYCPYDEYEKNAKKQIEEYEFDAHKYDNYIELLNELTGETSKSETFEGPKRK